MELIAIHKGRLFHLAAVQPYTRKDGGASTLAIWRGTCRVCGAAYEVSTPGSVGAFIKASAFGRVHCDAHLLHRKPKASPQHSEGMADLIGEVQCN